jgi:hypothetical protein
MRGGTAGDRTQGRWRRPWRLRAGANRPSLLIVLILIVPLMGIANAIDPPWSGGWYDDADADQLMSKTMSPEGMAGLAIVAFAYMCSRAVESARSASRRRLELCDRTGARGPPHVTNVLTGPTLVSHHAPRARLPFLRFQPRPLSGCPFAAPGSSATTSATMPSPASEVLSFGAWRSIALPAPLRVGYLRTSFLGQLLMLASEVR